MGRKASSGRTPAATPVRTPFAATAEPVTGEGGEGGGGGTGRKVHRLLARMGEGSRQRRKGTTVDERGLCSIQRRVAFVRGRRRSAGGGCGTDTGGGAGVNAVQEGQKKGSGAGRREANRPGAVGHASQVAQGARWVEVFTMTDEAFDGLGADELTQVLLGSKRPYPRRSLKRRSNRRRG